MAEKKFPPYLNAYNSIPQLFVKIKEAAVPPKFTYDFLHSVLGLKSSSHRALIPLLKRLDFLDAAGAPTSAYKDYRGEEGKSFILAEKLKKSYGDIYQANEYAHTLEKKDVENIVIRASGASKTDPQVAAVASTFLELVKLADFSGVATPSAPKKEEDNKAAPAAPHHQVTLDSTKRQGLGLSYTINLNLPPTTEVEVFNAIFKSLRENLLDE